MVEDCCLIPTLQCIKTFLARLLGFVDAFAFVVFGVVLDINVLLVLFFIFRIPLHVKQLSHWYFTINERPTWNLNLYQQL